MKVYLVGMGEYSEFHIEAVYLNRTKAELHCAVKESIDPYEPCWVIEKETNDDNIDGTVYYGVRAEVHGLIIDSTKNYISYDIRQPEAFYSLNKIEQSIIKSKNNKYKYKVVTVPVERYYDECIESDRDKIYTIIEKVMEEQRNGLGTS